MAPLVLTGNCIKRTNKRLGLRAWVSLGFQSTAILTFTPAQAQAPLANLVYASVYKRFVERIEVGYVVVIEIHQALFIVPGLRLPIVRTGIGREDPLRV